MTKSILTTLVCAALSGAAFAGTASVAAAGKGKAGPAPTPAAAPAALGLTLTAGYDSTYLWHGAAVGENLLSQRLEFNTALSDKVSLTLGEWFGHLEDFKYNELDLYAALSYNAGPATLSVGFTYYDYIDGGALDAQYEPFVKLSANGLPVDAYLAYYYETEVSGGYVELGLSKTFSLSNSVGLVASGQIGYNDGLTTSESGLNHIYLGLALPISLCNATTLTPFVGLNLAQDATEGLYKDDEVVVGGVAFSVKF